MSVIQESETGFTISNLVFQGIVQLVTLPYHRFFTNNTLRPILELEKHAKNGLDPTSVEWAKLISLVTGWQARKKDELGFVSLTGVAITAIVSASLAWPNVQDAYWVGSAFWYSSLITSVCGILIAAQQISLLILLGELPGQPLAVSRKRLERHLGQLLVPVAVGGSEERQQSVVVYQKSWKQIFTWQVPMMFVGYSFLFYFIGLTVVVCTPLIKQTEWGPDGYIAVTYIAASAISWGLFAFCSLGGYRGVTLHEEMEEEEDIQMLNTLRAPQLETAKQEKPTVS